LDEFPYEEDVRASSERMKTDSDSNDIGEARGGGDVRDMGR